MPVALLGGGEGPCDRAPGQAIMDVRVPCDVTIVIVINEGMAVDWIVEGQRRYHKQHTQNDLGLVRRGEKTLGPAMRGCRDLASEDMQGTGVFSVTHLIG